MKTPDRRRRGGRAPLLRFALALFVIVAAAVFCVAATVSAAAGPRWRACLSCHEDAGLFLTTAQGEHFSLAVAAAELGASAHRALECRACHPGVKMDSHPAQRTVASREAYRTAASLACRECHSPERLSALAQHGKAFATGYYEPEIAGSRTRSKGYDVPVYKRPSELVELDLGQFSDSLKGKKIRGRVEGKTFIPYADRTGIETGALDGRGLEIAWAADAIDFFVLQIQGSGRLRLPDGSVMRIGYDGQNGRDYTGIGKLMKDRGLLGPGQSSMQGIESWLRANPSEGQAIMRENKSWVFFREITGAGPLGALGLPVTGKASVATDPMFVPLGAPVLLSMDRAEASGIWIAQDTGGAIKGSNRFDTFWGAGDDARATAGGMSARGTAFVFLPKGVIARIGAGAGNASSQR